MTDIIYNNNTLFIFSIIAVFSIVVLLSRMFGKDGLIAWCGFAMFSANLILPKCITMFGIDCALANVMFASIFLATDIISEVFGKKAAQKAVLMAFCADVAYIAITQYVLLYQPNQFDTVDGAMHTLFAITGRTTTVSLIMFLISNIADVYLYAWLKKLIPNHLWLRNNVATMICNCFENFGLYLIGFSKILPMSECLELAIITSVIEIIIAICDTPFIYIGKKVCKREE